MPTLYRFILIIPLLFTAACSSLVDEGDETDSWSAQRFYTEAKQALDSSDYITALDLYAKLEARYPYGRYAQQAQLETAYAHYKAEESDAAIAAADRFIKLHPRHPQVDYAYYIKGLSAYDLDSNTLERWSGQDKSERDPKRARESFGYFRELVSRFPDSIYRDESIDRMKRLRNSLARYEIHVANYYLKRGAYLAAANRAKYVVENYQNTPAIPRALEVMGEAYQRLGLNDLAADIGKVQILNPVPALPQLAPPAAEE